MPSTLIQDLFKIRVYINHYLSQKDTEGFGCACEPDKQCATCKERERQEALILAEKGLKDLIEKEIKAEEEAFNEVLSDGIPDMPETAAKRWWFNKGYQVAPKITHVI